MSQQHNETSSATNLSRRSVTKGIGWAVPAAAVAYAAPAFAASPRQCVSFDWNTTPSTAPAPTTITGQTSNGETAEVTITPASGGVYNWADGNYGQQTLATSNGGVFLGTWANTGTTYAQRDQYGARLAMTFPSDATGPISFTVGDLTAAPGSSVDNVGANYYVDAVQVTNNGNVVSPSGTSGANLSGGWVQGTSTTPGSATYTIDEPGEVIVTLRNRTQETIASSAHPNQTISISRVVCGTTPPEPVTQPSVQCSPQITQGSGGAYFYQGANTLSRADYTLDGNFGVIQVTGIPQGRTVTRVTAEIFFAKASSLNTVNGYPSPLTSGVYIAQSRNNAQSQTNPYRGWGSYTGASSLSLGNGVYQFWDSKNNQYRTYVITDNGATRTFTQGTQIGTLPVWSVRAVWNRNDQFGQPSNVSGQPDFSNGCGTFRIGNMGDFGLNATNVLKNNRNVGSSAVITVVATLDDGSEVRLDNQIFALV